MRNPTIRRPATIALLSEVSQAKIRTGLHTLFVILTLVAYRFDPSISLISVAVISSASFCVAFVLFYWARHLQHRNAPINQRVVQRAASILSDNLFVTLVLAIGGQSTAGLWSIYLWTSIGYGVRYGINYLYANVVVSACAFGLMASTTPFWQGRPAFIFGMLLGMLLVPTYTGFLIKQLHRAVQERETAYKAKSEFLARMSHELRTPLHAIISTAELLKGKSNSAIKNDYVDTIALSSSTLLELINRVLDLSKFEAGEIGLAAEQINVHRLLVEGAYMLFQQAREKDIEIRLYLDPNIPLGLLGSPSHVREVLLNVLGNAVKFTDHGFVSISAHLDSESETWVNISFEIADSGIGIPERDLARIFEPFMQADQSKTRRHGGSGLGTSFSREIIRLMGGRIEISSVVGLGTRVNFSIPFDRCPLDPPGPVSSELTLAVLGAPGSRKFIETLLADAGGATIGYEDPNELKRDLVERNPEFRIDGIFVDGDTWGHSLQKIVKLISDLNLTRLIPVVGIGAPALKTVAITCGYTCFLTRTPTSSQLLSVLSSIESFARKGASNYPVTEGSAGSRELYVLVADDNATNRKIAQIALEEAGHRCTLVTNGDDALFALNDVEFDVAILDMHMPGRDGIEVAKIYRFAGFARETSIPIVLLTADCTKEARDEAESAGIAKFLTKPILPSEIVRIVEDIARSHEISSASVSKMESKVNGPDEARKRDRKSSLNPAIENDVPLLNNFAVAELISLMSKQEQTEFFDEFCEDATGYVRVVESIQSADDVYIAREAMHALAGAALILGATKLAQVARRIEIADKGAVLMKQTEYLAELTLVCEETIFEINQHFLKAPRTN